MTVQGAATRRPHHPLSRAHHMHVFQLTQHCWSWDCPCGGGIHDTKKALPDQPSALIAALVHFSHQAGA